MGIILTKALLRHRPLTLPPRTMQPPMQITVAYDHTTPLVTKVTTQLREKSQC